MLMSAVKFIPDAVNDVGDAVAVPYVVDTADNVPLVLMVGELDTNGTNSPATIIAPFEKPLKLIFAN